MITEQDSPNSSHESMTIYNTTNSTPILRCMHSSIYMYSYPTSGAGKRRHRPCCDGKLSKAIRGLHETAYSGHNLCKMDTKITNMVIISDASFANIRGFRSQLGYLIILADISASANNVHYLNSRCKWKKVGYRSRRSCSHIVF